MPQTKRTGNAWAELLAPGTRKLMSNDLDKDREWLQRLVTAMNEIPSPCGGASALDSQTHSLYGRLKLPAAAGASSSASFTAATWTPRRPDRIFVAPGPDLFRAACKMGLRAWCRSAPIARIEPDGRKTG